MDNKEYLNEDTYQKNNDKLKGIGKILLIVGIIILILSIILIALGFTGFGSGIIQNVGNSSIDMKETAGNAFSKMGLIAFGGFINFIGFGLTAAGIIICFISHRREITAYTVQQVMPVAKEGIDKMAPTMGNAAKEIAKGIKEGINEADNK